MSTKYKLNQASSHHVNYGSNATCFVTPREHYGLNKPHAEVNEPKTAKQAKMKMETNVFKYILRYYIDPGFHEDDRIEELLRFCEEGKVEEVMLFCNAEELNSGHVTEAELEPWFVMALKLKKRLDAAGIDLSLNPWTTTVHSPRGRLLKPGQNFTLMVGETGRDNGVTACPFCPEWRGYISRIFALMGERLNPVAIWIEDDFRLHNHGSQLGHGGCYCSLHLKEFAEMVGRNVTRKEVLQTILAPGKPHPWREMWLDLNNRAFLEAAVMLYDAVHQVAPSTRLALMCGLVDTAGTEGRNWHQLQDALGFEPAFMVRPTMSPYTEVWGMRKYPVYARQVVASLKRPLDVYPELESGPRHGPYSKGANYAAFELFGTACSGANGITMNLYDMMGCGTGIDPHFNKKLAEIKPTLNAIAGMHIDDDNSCGLNILFKPDIAGQIHSTSTKDPDGLFNFSAEWGKVAYILGIAHRYTTEVTPERGTYAVSDQTCRGLSDEEIMSLLGGSLLLDAKAVETLHERGFGKYVGACPVKWHKLRKAGFAYEEIIEKDPAVYGLADPRVTAQRPAKIILEMTADRNAEIRSHIRRYDHQNMFPGSVIYRNELGGRIVSVAYWVGDHQAGEEWFYMGYFNNYRRIFMQRMLFEIAPQNQWLFGEDFPLQCYRVQTTEGTLLACLNPATDAAPRISLKVSSLGKGCLYRLDETGRWQSAKETVTVNPDGSIQIISNDELPPLKGRFLLWRHC